jgi:hypothetical protein
MSAAQHIEWLNLVEKTGPFLAVGVLDETFPQGLEKVETRKRQRVRSAYEEWRDAVDNQDAQLDALHCEWIRLILGELLEFEPSVLKSADALPATLNYREPLTGGAVKPDFAVLSGDKARLLVACFAADTDLSVPLAGEAWPASPIERMTILCRATGVHVGLVTNGESWTVVSVPADGSSSLGTWFARFWQQEPITLQAFVSLLEVRRCFGPAEGTLDNLFLRSLEHQHEVTDTLGEQVRRAVEVLVQALDRADLDRDRQLLKDVSPTQLYEAGLTVMMRLVVLLCAEERKLLLLGEPIYDQYYAVSTLRSRLREDKERLGDEVLERRHDAWARLLAVFRAVFGGIEHETLRLPPLGGSLFDPDRFPFLEGRATGTSWRTTPAVLLPIDNRTVLMLLTALQVLEQRTGALLLSYEALDVEQIGHVYEGLLERTVKRVPETTLGLIGSQKAVNPNIPLHELEETKPEGNDKLLAFLLEKTGRSESGLKNALAKKVDESLYHRVLLACGSDTALADRIKPWSLLLRTDNWGDPLAYRENSFIVTMGAGRRETGTHYTPKLLTEPIVQHTLEPLVYIGPAEGKPCEQWRLKTSAEILALKVCDMAMGSGAFLVQSCRWLADRLVEAWDAAEKAGRVVSVEGEVLEQAGDVELLPRDKGERVLIARRLIASRCLYGVDKNPMAVELAKVSLWLVTMMKGRPFSFLDHALKCGDSLLGVSSLKQIENFSLRAGDRQVTFATANLFRYVEEADKKRRELENLPSNDYKQIEAKSRLNAEAEAAIAKVNALANCIIAFELRGLNGEQYEQQLAIAADHAEVAMRKPLPEFQSYAQEQLLGRPTFHWPVEFPEVFSRGGFDALVGNPPYLGAPKLTGTFGNDYRDFLIAHLAHGVKGLADLCAYFVLRTDSLLSPDSLCGLIVTSAIAEGDTRTVGVQQLTDHGWDIVRATSRAPWPGAASVTYSSIWLSPKKWGGGFHLNDEVVPGITPMLTVKQSVSGSPHRLSANLEKSFNGVKVYGDGFVLITEEAQALIQRDARNKTVLFPYITTKDVNSHPTHATSSWAIRFFDWPLDRESAPPNYSGCVASDFPDCLAIVEERVKPERTRRDEQGNFVVRDPMPQLWWIYGEKRPGLYAAISRLRHVLAVGTQATKYVAFATLDKEMVFSHSLSIIADDSFETFAVLHSSLHEVWARHYGGYNLALLRYSPTDLLETFPFPPHVKNLEMIGLAYHEHRRKLMLARQEGLTDIYNHFHDRSEPSADIARLRSLHAEMDQAVAAAYGWSDLDLGHGFHETKQGVRYTLSESARHTVLDRLLQLNHQRYEEEVKAGLHEKGAKRGKGKKAKMVSPETDFFR